MTKQGFYDGADAVKVAKLTRMGIDPTTLTASEHYAHFLTAGDEYATKLVDDDEAQVYTLGEFWPAVEAECVDPEDMTQRDAAIDELAGFLKLPTGKTQAELVAELEATWPVYFAANLRGGYDAEEVYPATAVTNTTVYSSKFIVPQDATTMQVEVTASGISAESVAVSLLTGLYEDTLTAETELGTIDADGTSFFNVQALALGAVGKLKFVITGTVTVGATVLPRVV